MKASLFSTILLMVLSLGTVVESAGQDLPAGFQVLSGQYIEIVTDLPLDEDMRQLPAVFDAAVPSWCKHFGLKLDDIADWHATAYIMLDRDRFQRAGFIPPELPNFPFGFQFEDRLWVVEQPSPYYRRHLLLHEGTHWFMLRKYGAAGPPWLMEGMAEWLGTHRWDGETLTMGIVPKDKLEVPYWGRITLIQQQLNDGSAPSLEAILRYSDTAHQRVDAYAWSWAAVIFLQNHPETSDIFKLMFEQPMRNDNSLTRWLFARLRARWPDLRQEWSAFLTDLEYGTNPARAMLQANTEKVPPLGTEPQVVKLDATAGWQSAGVRLDAPGTIKLVAEGRYSVADTPAPWVCEPAGVTLEYYRGQPLGKLLMTSLAPQAKEPEHSQPLEIIAVGTGGEFLVPAGELFFKINEGVSGLSDNSGTLTVTIKP